MFRAVTIISVIAAILVAVNFAGRLAGKPSKISRVGRFPLFETFLALVMWSSVTVLALTGFIGATMFDQALSGFAVLVQAGCGALFAVSFALLAVFRAEACNLAEADTCGRFSITQKICFWVIGVCGLGLISSILISMFPILGTDGQHMAVMVHRCSALIALLATIIYAGAASRRG